MSLRPFVHHYWIMKTCKTNMSQLIMPTGFPRWIFHRKTPLEVNGTTDAGLQASVVGLYEKAIHVSALEDVEMITVFFYPYAIPIIMGIPGCKFTHCNVDFDSLENPAYKQLKSRVLEAETSEACIDIIENFILGQIVRTQDSPYFKPLAKAFQLLATNLGAHIDELASAACLSERQFRRVFSSYVGLSPKQFQCIQRFHLSTKEILQTNCENLNEALYMYGYTDRSHFNHEFHKIAGISPTKYLSLLEKIRKEDMIKAYRSYHTTE